MLKLYYLLKNSFFLKKYVLKMKLLKKLRNNIF